MTAGPIASGYSRRLPNGLSSSTAYFLSNCLSLYAIQALVISPNNLRQIGNAPYASDLSRM
jgi:hypothetical protein